MSADVSEIRDTLDGLYPRRWALLLTPICGPHHDCQNPGKEPHRTGHHLEALDRYRRGDTSERESHLNRIARHVAGGANVALVIPPDAVALDVETAATIARAHSLAEDRMPAYQTSGPDRGHIVFRLPSGAKAPGAALVAGEAVVTRSEAQYIVCEPSTHQRGSRYEWDTPLSEFGDVATLPPIPEVLLERATRPKNGSVAPREGAVDWRDCTEPGSVPPGLRHPFLAHRARRHAARGVGDAAELESLLERDLEHYCAEGGSRSRADVAREIPDLATWALGVDAASRQEDEDSKADLSDDDRLRAQLAEMDDLAYHRQRKELAKAAGIGVTALDTVRDGARKAAREARVHPQAQPATWPAPVDGARLAADLEAALRRFVVMGASAYTLVTLWAIGTHAYAARHVWPLLLARSPQPACGKSTLLDVLERIVARPFAAANASLATLFRSAANGPTQLLDELDRWIARGDDELLGFLNAGWQSGRPFVRCHPETHEIQEFPSYCPKALALIGDVENEALRSRCIVVEMRRALPGERPERFRAGRAHPDLADLQAQAARWARDHADAVGEYELGEDELPGLTARAADNAEALLAVAEAIGGEWPQRARDAVTAAPVEESQDLGAMLLSDLAGMLEALPAGSEAVATDAIIKHLNALEDRPWPTVRKGGKAIEANWLRRRLAPFGIRPGRPYIGGVQVRGYALAPIREAIGRYLAHPLPGTPDEVPQPSCRLGEEPSDALRAPESPPASRQDTQDASIQVPEEGVSGSGLDALELEEPPW